MENQENHGQGFYAKNGAVCQHILQTCAWIREPKQSAEVRQPWQNLREMLLSHADGEKLKNSSVFEHKKSTPSKMKECFVLLGDTTIMKWTRIPVLNPVEWDFCVSIG